jgi:hypothetical protein
VSVAQATYSKESVLAAKPVSAAGQSPSQWVDNAVSVMRDFEQSRTPDSTGHAFWSNSLQGIKSAAAKLNVFA